MKVAVIGTGGRSLAYIPIINELADAEVTVLCDIDEKRLNEYHETYFKDAPQVKKYVSYEEAIACDEVDTVLILTPDTVHRDIFACAIRNKKHILLEKPIATTMEDAKSIYELGKDYDKTIAVGFVLRYTPFYSKIKEIVQSGELGKIVSISAKEVLNPRHGGSFFRRWHRFSVNNGGVMNAKCSHDLDILNWIVDADPEYISAFGGNHVFIPNEKFGKKCSDCTQTDQCNYYFDYQYYSENFKGFHSLSDMCVYNSEKDIVDHESVNIQFKNGVTALFELCMIGADENRFITIFGTEATLNADFESSEIEIKTLKGEHKVIRCEGLKTGHGGGDNNIITELYQSITTGKTINHARAGFLSTATALAGEVSMKTHSTINMKEFAGI